MRSLTRWKGVRMPIIIAVVVVVVLLVATIVSHRRERRWAERASNQELVGFQPATSIDAQIAATSLMGPGGGISRS